MNKRQKIKLLKQRLAEMEHVASSMVRDRCMLDTSIIVGSCVRELHHKFRHEECKRWVEFNIDHPEAGSVHVVLMKPGSQAEELVVEQNKKITELECVVREYVLGLRDQTKAETLKEVRDMAQGSDERCGA